MIRSSSGRPFRPAKRVATDLDLRLAAEAVLVIVPDTGHLTPDTCPHPPYLLAMSIPKTTCRTPKPAARKAVPHDGGQKRAIAPSIMNPIPMTGTTRTAKAPPVTTAVP